MWLDVVRYSDTAGGTSDYPVPGKPMQNGHVESFDGKFRDDCLNPDWFTSLKLAKNAIEQWLCRRSGPFFKWCPGFCVNAAILREDRLARAQYHESRRWDKDFGYYDIRPDVVELPLAA